MKLRSLLRAFCLSLLVGSCSSNAGPSDADAKRGLDEVFKQNWNNPYHQICEGEVKINILNRQVEGKEALVRIEGTWKSRMFECKERTATFDLRFVNRDGKWELAM